MFTHQSSHDRAVPSVRRSFAGRLERARIGLLPLLLLFTACDSMPVGPEVARLESTGVHPWATEAATLIDAHRSTLGCAPLRWHQTGAEVAESYARQMNDEAFFGHVDPKGTTLKQRLGKAGISGYRRAAETIAAGQDDATKVVGDWIASPDHRAILEDCQYNEIGLGFHEGEGPYREYWTAVFFATR